jgi:hypothetical protein
MDETSDKPAGSEQHPPNVNPGRQGPGRDRGDDDEVRDRQSEQSGPPPEGSPGEPGVTSPKRGKI